MSGAERCEQITAEIMARTGITEAMIERLVHGFYAKVRSDAVLADQGCGGGDDALARCASPGGPWRSGHFTEL